MTPIVSVVLPVHDAAATLGAALDSLLSQSLREVEILVVDDGSTDGSRAITRRFASRDARIVPIEGPHRGIVPALNSGLAAARAPLIARMDADDVSHPERLERQAGFLREHPGIGLVSCRVEFGGDPALQEGYALHVAWANALIEPEEISLHRFVESPFAHPSVMFRRELPTVHGGYREGEFPEDYELWLRWLDAGVRMAKLPLILLAWNDPPGRLSRTDPRYSKDAFFRIKAEYLARWLARHNPHHPAITAWGASRLARRRAEHLLPLGIEITRHVDISPRLIGRVIAPRHAARHIAARPVIPPDDLPNGAFVVVFVASRGSRDIIRARLQAKGRVMGRDFLLAA